MKKNIIEKAKKIKLIAMDIDGVLTAGEFIVFNSGEEVKIWNIKDRFGFALLRNSGIDIKLAWITARESEQVAVRAKELKIEFLFQKCFEKSKALEEIANKTGFKKENMLFAGDDWLDIPAMSKAGLSVCPKDAHEEVIKIVDYVSKYEGGKGVFREIVEIILNSRNLYEKSLQNYKK